MMDISPCRLATMRHHDRDYQNDPIDRPVSWVVSFSRKWLRFVAAAGPNRTFRPEHRDLDTQARFGFGQTFTRTNINRHLNSFSHGFILDNHGMQRR